MKNNRLYIALSLCFTLLFTTTNLLAQSNEAQQLLLNVEKLGQLKNILQDMKKGYSVLSNGYNAVKNISQGNFSIHEVFINGLMLVSPQVRKYAKVADIITAQKNIVLEYKQSFSGFSSSDLFTSDELNYLSRVYAGLLSTSLDNLDELTLVLTTNQLRMSDQDRLTTIDRIFEKTTEKLNFLRSFNREATLLMVQRKSAKADHDQLKSLF